MKCKRKNKIKKKRPLQRVVFFAILIEASVFMFILTTISLFQNMRGIFSDLKREARRFSSYTLSLMDMDYVEDLFKQVKDIYYNTPEEIRHDQKGAEYQKLIAPLSQTDDFYAAREIMRKCQEHADFNNIALFFLDEEYERFVVVIDGDVPELFARPGEWFSDENGEVFNSEEIEKITNSTWYLQIANASSSGWASADFIELKGKDGQPIGYISVDIKINTLMTGINRYMRIYTIILFLVLIAASFLISLQLRRRIIDPINKLVITANSYIARDKVAQSEATSFFSKLDISTHDEIEELKDTMSEIEADAANTRRRIRQVTTEQERLKRQQERITAELDIAKNIQASTLPSVFPSRPEFDMYASMTPAKEVGGDFYDFFLIDLDHLGLVIADVSGKGVPAALFMMISKQILRNKALVGGTPAQVLTSVNTNLSENNVNAMFVTIWFGILTISTGELIASNAGHEYPFITDETGNYRLYKDPHGLACAVIDGMLYDDYTVTLKPGDRLFLYTDGVAEANAPNGELFGPERTEEALNKYKDLSPQEQVESVHKEINAFAGEHEQFDDITMLCLHYKGPVDE